MGNQQGIIYNGDLGYGDRFARTSPIVLECSRLAAEDRQEWQHS